MKNKKGISIAITAIVVIAVAMVVLLVVLGYFVGGFTRTGGAMRDVTVNVEEKGGGELEEGLEEVGEIWKAKIGEACEDDEDCRSGNCDAGACAAAV